MEGISEYFSAYFSLVIANTPELLAEVFKVRYQVYCEELGYEPKDKFPDQMEKDIYDGRSIHCLLKHNSSGRYVGCIRLVLTDPQQPESLFPFEQVCPISLEINPQTRPHFCEVSRLAVISDFRKRKGEAQTTGGLLFFEESPSKAQAEKRRFPLIALSLYLAVTCVTLETSHLQNLLAIMEPRLARQLRIFGFHFRRVGDVVEYHGKRGPFMITKEDWRQLSTDLHPSIYELFQTIHSDVKRQLSYSQLNKFSNALTDSDSRKFSLYS